MNPFQYLLEVPFDLFLFFLMLRIWLQAAKADFYNPVSQMVVKLTSPVLAPLRRVIPGLWGIDLAGILLMLLVAFLKIFLVLLIFQGEISILITLIYTVKSIFVVAYYLLFVALIARVIFSFVDAGYNPVNILVQQLTEPLLRPIRRVVPPVAGFDFSVLIVFIALNFLSLLVAQYV
ncbi:YggT family protein [Algicola sagamiensis]|uniref:YggT family protein n=1 Tax=Algicola sagamiensis TaxID=163869 RepID=UPI000360B37A|nr:YggT family protein [Algicola sagamiensis]